MIKRIVPDIYSDKLEESKEFYGRFLGLDLVMDLDWILTFASHSHPGAQLSILHSEKPENSKAQPCISIEVEDVDAFYKSARSYKYEIPYDISNEEWGVRRFFVKDPNGVVINIMMHRK